MDIAKAFEAAFNRKREKAWEKIYVVVDIHDTILRASYGAEETYDYLPYARKALQVLSCRDDICLILWSGCYPDRLAAYRERFAQDGIHFDYINENPEVGNTPFQNFGPVRLRARNRLDSGRGGCGETIRSDQTRHDGRFFSKRTDSPLDGFQRRRRCHLVPEGNGDSAGGWDAAGNL